MPARYFGVRYRYATEPGRACKRGPAGRYRGYASLRSGVTPALFSEALPIVWININPGIARYNDRPAVCWHFALSKPHFAENRPVRHFRAEVIRKSEPVI